MGIGPSEPSREWVITAVAIVLAQRAGLVAAIPSSRRFFASRLPSPRRNPNLHTPANAIHRAGGGIAPLFPDPSKHAPPMAVWKDRMIRGYRLATWPIRHGQHRMRVAQGTVPVWVLFYHRVADDDPNPWTISCDNFCRQVDWLQERFELVDLAEAQRRIASHQNHQPTLSITFDDGYAENNEFALPLLIRRKIPVTYFVTTNSVLEQKPFKHDLERNRKLPTHSLDSLRALAQSGVEIGAHTRSHPDLGAMHDPHRLADEVLTSARELAQALGQPIRYFAFPFGQRENLNRDVFAMLRQAGFEGACSAYGGWNDVGQDPFHLQRIHGDPNLERLKNWLTFDPRLARVQRFDHRGGHADPTLVQQALAAAHSGKADVPQQAAPFPGSLLSGGLSDSTSTATSDYDPTT